MDGILLIDKEAGFTSHDVIAVLRGILHMKKIGHAGTLDPDATGLLPVCLGRATKCVNLLSDAGKRYEAVLRLGVVTDTQDMSGTVLRECPVNVSEEEAERVIRGFIGGYDQVPPMYSAKKIGGKKLYELARAGKEAERQPVRIEISDIAVNDISLPEISITVSCGKGTYIRTLCHDIGEKLGCGAAMKQLRRTAVSGYSVEDALTLDDVRRYAEEGTVTTHITGLEKLFSGYKKFTVEESHEKALFNGNRLLLSWGACESLPEDGEPAAVYDSTGRLQALYTFHEEEQCLTPLKMLLNV